jgi:hypothetical protein
MIKINQLKWTLFFRHGKLSTIPSLGARCSYFRGNRGSRVAAPFGHLSTFVEALSGFTANQYFIEASQKVYIFEGLHCTLSRLWPHKRRKVGGPAHETTYTTKNLLVMEGGCISTMYG